MHKATEFRLTQHQTMRNLSVYHQHAVEQRSLLASRLWEPTVKPLSVDILSLTTMMDAYTAEPVDRNSVQDAKAKLVPHHDCHEKIA